MPRIPYGEKYTISATGAKWKLVLCKNCGCEYVYMVKTTASGTAENLLWLNKQGAIQKAEERASKNLNKRLDKLKKEYPCPNCGHYQPEMIQRMKVAILQKAVIFGFTASIIAALGIGFVALIASQLLKIIPPLNVYLPIGIALGTGLLVGVGVGGVILGQLINFNPNAMPSMRKNQPFSENFPVLRKAELEKYLVTGN